MSDSSVRIAGVVALAACVSASSCYWGFGAGPAFVTGRSQSKSGANSMTELGLMFDYHRTVRVMYARSLQLNGGAQLTADGQHLVAPLQNQVEVQVTALRWSPEVYLRVLARGFWGSDVKVGPDGQEVSQPGASAYGGMLGATLLLAGDHEQLGQTGLALSAGLLVGRAETRDLGRVSFLAPMVMVGFDFFPPLLIDCLLIDDKCPHNIWVRH